MRPPTNREWAPYGISVSGSQVLHRVAGFDALVALTGNLTITAPALTELSAFSSLAYLDGALTVNASRLEAIEGFGDLLMTAGDVTMSLPPETDAFRALVRVYGALTITGDSEVLPLTSLTEVKGILRLQGLQKLEDLGGLESLTSVGGLWIEENGALVHLNGLSGVRRLSGQGLLIRNNGALRSIAGLMGVTSFVGPLDTYDNLNLPTCDVEALAEHMRSIGWTGSAVIYGNDDSASCEGGTSPE